MDDVGKPNVLISTKIARDYPNSDGTPKKVNDTILIGGKPFKIIGIYETGSFLIDMTVVTEITTARKLLNIDEGNVSTFYLEPDPFTDIATLGDRITSAIPDVQIRSMSQFNLQVGNIMGKLDMFLILTVGLALLVGGVGIANTMLMSAMERFVEFGVMRRQWLDPSQHPRPGHRGKRPARLGLRAAGQSPGFRSGRSPQQAPLPVRAQARSHCRTGRHEYRRRDTDRDARRPVPRLACLTDDPDGCDT